MLWLLCYMMCALDVSGLGVWGHSVQTGHDAGDWHNVVDWVQAMVDVCSFRIIQLGIFLHNIDS